MRLSDFQIDLEFFTAAGQWRCTDIGTRTIPIRINRVEVGSDAPERRCVLPSAEAEAEGLVQRTALRRRRKRV